MRNAVKLGVRREVVIPEKIRRELGLAAGDYLNIALDGERVVLTPRRILEKRLAESFEDFKKGRTLGPFKSAASAMRALRARTR